jgi:hypothetical protein
MVCRCEHDSVNLMWFSLATLVGEEKVSDTVLVDWGISV